MDMSKAIADTIIAHAKDVLENEGGQNINSSIHAVKLEVTQHLMEFMADHKE